MSFSVYRTFIDPLLKGLRETVVSFATIDKGDTILDVCCGTGAQTLVYAAAGISATGIDLNPSMITTANEQKEKRGLARAIFEVADSTALPFADNSFVFASISLALHDKNADFQHKTLQEMKRVVKKGGHLILVDYSVPVPSNMNGFFVRSIERLAGGEHYANYRAYVKSNGLVELIAQHKLKENTGITTQGGVMLMVKTNNG
ncbi:MAG: methyltransferase domain-containing protein [Chloroflexi bacterium]|nr:methyltransferase domain-containing protein [Chloroflexota bacterium]